jgi:hypothetical protein
MSSNLKNCFHYKHLTWLLGLLLAVAVTPSMLHAEDWDHLNGRDKGRDPTGLWLLNTSILEPNGEHAHMIIDFHAGGTLTFDVQGASSFDPAAVTDPANENNVISSPGHGLWQKTGWNTFGATSLGIQYHVVTNPPSAPVFQYGLLQFAGKLTRSGDTMEITGQETHYEANGNKKNHGPFNANGVRIPLTLLPNTINPLPIPSEPLDPK